jgi:hypothetical protein
MSATARAIERAAFYSGANHTGSHGGDYSDGQGVAPLVCRLRPGLEQIRMKHVLGPRDLYIDDMTYYVATELTGTDGLPPVAQCNHDDPRNGGGTGFLWQDRIWAGIRMNQQHCADWPEIYQTLMSILALLREAEQ